MNRNFMFICIFACIMILSVSCKKEPGNTGNGDGTEPPKITITTPVINADAAGGLYTIGYTLENQTDGGAVSAFCPDEYGWISIMGSSETGEITINLERNENKEDRTAYLTVTYKNAEASSSGQVEIIQSADTYDVTLDAGNAVCEYYGEMFTGKGGEHSYFLMLSDLAWDAANAKVYKFDMYAGAPEDISSPKVIPGTYTLGKRGETKEMTFTPEFSSFGTNNAAGTEYTGYAITDGTLEIIQDGDNYNCRAVLNGADGNLHSVTYYGPITVYDYAEPIPDFYSTLENDVEIDFTDVEIEAYYYGDYYGFGTYNWYLDIKSPTFEGDTFILELNQSADNFAGGIAEGTYTASKTGEGSTFLPGKYENGTQIWSWYDRYELSADKESFDITLKCPIYGGEINVSKNNDGTYTLELDCTDDNLENPHRITGTWKGYITFIDHRDFNPAPAQRETVRPCH